MNDSSWRNSIFEMLDWKKKWGVSDHIFAIKTYYFHYTQNRIL